MLYTLPYETESRLEDRIRTSRLMGSNPDLVLHGGGNTSVKSSIVSMTGKKINALFVKGSGSDLSKIEADGFTTLDLDGLIEAKELNEMNDEDMISFFRVQMLDPSQSDPSVETFLHAFIPFEYV
ncbi:MAG: class II aldolase/adducin family protein, partial [Thermoplasmatales archaeon]